MTFQVLWGTKPGEDEHPGWIEEPRMTFVNFNEAKEYIITHRLIIDREPFVETWEDGVSLHIEDYKTWSMPAKARRNLAVIKNFILYWSDDDDERETMNTVAEIYVDEDHVDGRSSE